MNIKGLVRNILPTEVQNTSGPKKAIKSDQASDRDGNGQQSQPEPEKRQLNEDELQAAIAQLKEIPGIKSNNLSVRLIVEGQLKFVLIEDLEGKVVRRISERDLGQLLNNRTKDKGQLFNRAM